MAPIFRFIQSTNSPFVYVFTYLFMYLFMYLQSSALDTVGAIVLKLLKSTSRVDYGVIVCARRSSHALRRQPWRMRFFGDNGVEALTTPKVASCVLGVKSHGFLACAREVRVQTSKVAYKEDKRLRRRKRLAGLSTASSFGKNGLNATPEVFCNPGFLYQN